MHIVNVNDSIFKKFCKEFYDFKGTRYIELKRSNRTIELAAIKKSKLWQTNALKVALCFTLVIPFIVGIYTIAEKLRLHHYTFIIKDIGKELKDLLIVSGHDFSTTDAEDTKNLIDSLYHSIKKDPVLLTKLTTFSILNNSFGAKAIRIDVYGEDPATDNQGKKRCFEKGCHFFPFLDAKILGISTNFLVDYKKALKIEKDPAKNPELNKILTSLLDEIKFAVV